MIKRIIFLFAVIFLLHSQAYGKFGDYNIELEDDEVCVIAQYTIEKSLYNIDKFFNEFKDIQLKKCKTEREVKLAKNKLSNIENILNNQTESFRKLLSNIRKYRETNDSEECHFLQNEIRLSHATAINAKSDKISFASPLLEIIKVDFNLNSENIKITTSNNIVDSKIAYAEEEKQKIEKERKKAEQELYEAKKILEEQKLQNEKNEKNRSYIDDINTQIAQIKAETERLKIHNDNMISEQKKFEEKLELAQKEKYEQEQANLRAQHPLKMGFRGIPWETTGDKLEKQYGLKVSYESVNNGVTDVKTKDGDIEVTDGKIVISDGYNEEIIYGDTDFLTKQTKTVE